MDKVYTAKEVAEILRVHENTIYRMIQNGRLKHVRAGDGKKILIPDWAINEFLMKPE